MKTPHLMIEPSGGAGDRERRSNHIITFSSVGDSER